MSTKSNTIDILLREGPVLDDLTVAVVNARQKPNTAILGIDHVQLAVPQGGEGDCRSFYLHVLGLLEIERPKVAEGRSFLWARAGLQQLHFRVDPGFSPAEFAHPGLIVADAEAPRSVVRELRAAQDLLALAPRIGRAVVRVDAHGERHEVAPGPAAGGGERLRRTREHEVAQHRAAVIAEHQQHGPLAVQVVAEPHAAPAVVGQPNVPRQLCTTA